MRTAVRVVGLLLLLASGICGVSYYYMHGDPLLAAKWAEEAEARGAKKLAILNREAEAELRLKNYAWLGTILVATPLGVWLLIRRSSAAPTSR